MSDYNRAINLDSGDATAYDWRGIISYERIDYRGALADFNKAIEINPKFKSSDINRAAIYIEATFPE